MFTSDNRMDNNLKTSFSYLIISIALALFGAVYEYFSFGVWSAFMVYAFMVPLLGGALPFALSYIRKLKKEERTEYRYCQDNASEVSGRISGRLIYHMALATLTVGSILKGVLDIYGTTNRLMIVYPAAGIALIIIAAVLMIREKKAGRTSRDTIVYTAEPENTIG